MTPQERNKQVVAEFLGRFTAMDLAGVMASFTDDATWWIAGRRERIPTSGLHTRERIGRIFEAMREQLVDGLKMTVRSAIAEGDRVAVEVESLGTLKNGRVYNQQYHLLVTVRDGRIAAVREYLDTQHVHDVWFAP